MVALQLLNRILVAEPKPIRMTGIIVSKLISAEKQYCMFDSRDERWESLDKAIDKIRMKYGEKSIKSGYDMSIRNK